MLFQHVLVATDFSDCSEEALKLGVKMAESLSAALTIVHAWDVPAYVYTTVAYVPSDMVTPVLDAAKAYLDEAVARARVNVPDAKGLLRRGSPWREILAARDEVGADVIVLGTHGRGGLAHVFLGSVAERVVRTSPVPVLTVHAARPLQPAAHRDDLPPAAPIF